MSVDAQLSLAGSNFLRLRRRLADVEVRRAADGLRPGEPVEVRKDRLEGEPRSRQLALYLRAERGVAWAVAVGQQDPALGRLAQRFDAPRGEESHAFRGVRRVAEHPIRPGDRDRRKGGPQ